MFLTWLIEEPALYDKIKSYITPKDFTEKFFREVAEMLYEQFEKGASSDPARIISRFTDEEEQRKAAGMFNASYKAVRD